MTLVPCSVKTAGGRQTLLRGRRTKVRRRFVPRKSSEAASATAAVTIRDGRTTSEVDVGHAQAELRRQCVRLD